MRNSDGLPLVWRLLITVAVLWTVSLAVSCAQRRDQPPIAPAETSSPLAPRPSSEGTRSLFFPLLAGQNLPADECWADWPASLAMERFPENIPPAQAEAPPEVLLPVRFEDATASAGVERVTYSYGLAWGDFDRDGDEDLFLSNHGSPPQLLVNQGDGTFVEQATALGIPPGGRDGHGTAWGDYDGDGDLDLLIVQGKRLGQANRLDQLYRNDGQAGFVLVTEEAGVGNPGGRARSASWIDYDGDGDLDLLVVNYQTPTVLYVNDGAGHFAPLSPFVTDDLAYWEAASAQAAAWSDFDLDGDLDLFLSGVRSRLLRQEDGRFEDVTAQAFARMPVGGTGAAWGDFDNDGYPDLYLARRYGGEVDFLHTGEHFLRAGGTTEEEWEGVDFATLGGVMLALYRNGAQRQAEVYLGQECLHPAAMPLVLMAGDPRACGEPTAVAEGPAYRVWRDCPGHLWHLRWRGGTAGVEFTARVDAQCRLSSVQSVNQNFEPAPEMPNVLFHNNGDGTFKDIWDAGVADPGNGQGVVWLDVDNDGWLDLFVVNRGNARVGNEADRLYHNQGDGRFVEIGQAAGVAGDPLLASGGGAIGGGGAVAWADYDGDGWPDLFVTNGFGSPPDGEGPHKLYHNLGGANHWLEVKLVDRHGGGGSGARVTLRAGQLVQRQEQTGGAGLFSQNSQVLHFGLGQASQADSLVIEWPGGLRQELEVLPADQVLVVEEAADRLQRGYSFVQPDAPVPFDTVGTWAITYVAGDEGLPAGSDVYFYLRNRPPWSPMQALEPNEPGYVYLAAPRPSAGTVVATRSDEEETCTHVQITEPLGPGDRVTLAYENALAPYWGAALCVKFPVCVRRPGETACRFVPHENCLQLVAPQVQGLKVTAPAIVAPNESFTVTVAALWNVTPFSEYKGTVEFSSSDPKAVLPSPYTFTEEDAGTHHFAGLRLNSSGVFTLTVRDTMDDRLVAHSNPVVTDWTGPQRIYFGDLHVHTQLHRDWEINEPDDLDAAYTFARDAAALDFVAITDHDNWMTDGEWALHQQKRNEYNQPGRFVTLLAYEWTGTVLQPRSIGCPADTPHYGHRNVYFPGDSGPLIRFRDGCSPPERLWEGLAGTGALTIPHHPSVFPGFEMDWEHFNPQFDLAVEVVQYRGSSEYEPGEKSHPHPASVQAALARGYRLGFVGGTDNHVGQAGVLKGITAILAPELSRGALFEALRQRRTYATTGARILIDFRFGDHPMGSIVHTSATPVFDIRVVGTAPIARLDIVKNNADVRTLIEPGQHVEFRWSDPGFHDSAGYYLRLTQEDGQMAWTSPIWVERLTP